MPVSSKTHKKWTHSAKLRSVSFAWCEHQIRGPSKPDICHMQINACSSYLQLLQWFDVNGAHNCVVLYAQNIGKVGRIVNAKMCLAANVGLETDWLKELHLYSIKGMFQFFISVRAAGLAWWMGPANSRSNEKGLNGQLRMSDSRSIKRWGSPLCATWPYTLPLHQCLLIWGIFGPWLLKQCWSAFSLVLLLEDRVRTPESCIIVQTSAWSCANEVKEINDTFRCYSRLLYFRVQCDENAT